MRSPSIERGIDNHAANRTLPVTNELACFRRSAAWVHVIRPNKTMMDDLCGSAVTVVHGRLGAAVAEVDDDDTKARE